MSDFVLPMYTPVSAYSLAPASSRPEMSARLARLQTPFEGDTLLFDATASGLGATSSLPQADSADVGSAFFGDSGKTSDLGSSIAAAFGGAEVPDSLTPLELFQQRKNALLGSFMDTFA